MKNLPVVLGILAAILAVSNSLPAPDAGSSACSGGGEFQADSSDCSVFYQCASGRAVLQHCPAGLHWNAKASICDWPANAACGGGGDGGEGSDESESGDSSKSSGDDSTSEESVPGSKSSSSESSECPKDKKTPKCPAKDPANSVFFPHSDPHWFYHCSNGVAYCKPCPANLVWNTNCDTCDWEGQNNCPEPESSESGDNSDSSGDDSTSEESVPGSDSTSEEDEPETPKPKPPTPKPEEPSSESGDSSKSSGDDSTSEESVPGSDSSSSESSECPNDKKTPKCPAKDPAKSVFFPHSDRHWFYHCSNGVAYCKPCPANLVWNTNCDTCDWEGQNNCPQSSESGDSSKSSGDASTSEESVEGSKSSSEE